MRRGRLLGRCSVRLRRPARLVALTGAAVVALGFTSAAAPALGATGSVSGTVTATASHAPIAGIEVCAITTASLEEEEEEGEGAELGSEQLGCVKTGAGGEYTVSGLAGGTFLVVWGNPSGGSLNYITQFYEDKSSAGEATHVTVTAGATTAGIDAELREGAELSGTVTSASTGAPIEGALVCAGAPPREPNCTFSGAGGAYQVVGLEGGMLVLGAYAREYAVGYYGGAASVQAAATLAVSAGEKRQNLNIALKPSPSTSSVLGGKPPGGAGTPGAPGASSNTGGKSTGGPGSLPLAGAPSAGVGLANSLVDEHARRRLVVRLTCASASSCAGKVALTVKHRVRRAGRWVTVRLEVGAARFRAKRDGTFVVRVLLDRRGRSLLRAAHGRLAARLRISQSTPGPAQTTVRRVTLLGERARPRRHR